VSSAISGRKRMRTPAKIDDVSAARPVQRLARELVAWGGVVAHAWLLSLDPPKNVAC
jgi:hypothetical protein